METSIREFRWTDVEAVATLINQSRQAYGLADRTSSAEVARFLNHPGIEAERDCFVAELDGQIAAAALLHYELGARLIYRLELRPGVQEAAVGAPLLQRCLAHAKAFVEPVLDVPASPEEKNKIALLQEMGFVHVVAHARHFGQHHRPQVPDRFLCAPGGSPTG